MRARVYDAWRRSEAYAVPMTEEGEKQAAIRQRSFYKGFDAGLKCAAEHLEQMHKKEKDTTKAHNFYLIASNACRLLTWDIK